MASFMNETWRRTAWPSEAADCSAPRSGSARRTATSVMAEDISLSSCARHASMARNQNRAIGRQMVASHDDHDRAGQQLPGNWLRAISGASMAQASRPPTASHPPEPAAASMKGRLDGFCCRAKISPPMEGASSLAAMRARGGAAGRRLAARLGPFPSLDAGSGEAGPAASFRCATFCGRRAISAAQPAQGLSAGGGSGISGAGSFLAPPGRGDHVEFRKRFDTFGIQ